MRDLDAAIEFYGRAFGLPLVHRETNEEQGVEEAMVGIGDSCIQLLSALTPTSAIGKFLERNGEGIQQVAFRVMFGASRSPGGGCATPGCACSTTAPAAARPGPTSTSCTPRTPAACSSSSSSPAEGAH